MNGTLYCLRNDLSQAVLWYNAPLLKKFGYPVPTTWEEYQALGEKVAKEHPGYLVGDAGDSFTPEIYLWASKCGANHITGPKAVSVNTTSEACTKMATLLDALIKNKSMSISGVFSTDFGKNEADKVLLHARPGLVRRRAVRGHLQDAGQADRGRAHARSGRATTSPSTGNVGGGTWLLSAHCAHLKAATDFLKWVTTDNAYQGEKAPGYPAYAPAAEDVAGGAGRLRLLRRRPHRAAQGRRRPGVARLGLGPVQPGGDLGRHRQARADRRARASSRCCRPGRTPIVNYAKSNGYKVVPVTAHPLPGRLGPRRAPSRRRPAEPGRARLRRRLRGPADRLRRPAHRLRDLLRLHRRRRAASPACPTSPPRRRTSASLAAVEHVALYLALLAGLARGVRGRPWRCCCTAWPRAASAGRCASSTTSPARWPARRA